MRRTAQRVDAQMVDYMRAHAIEGPWAAGERLLVAIDGAVGGAALVRHARRLADRLRAPWTAIHVETSRDLRADETERNGVAEVLRLATRLGGVAVTLPGEDAAAAILDYAQTHNVTHILIAQTGDSNWLELSARLDGAKAHLARRRHQYSYCVDGIAAEGEAPQACTTPHPSRDWAAYAKSLGFVAGAGLFAFLVREALGISSVALVFLIGVLASAVSYGLFPSLFAALVSVLAYNFFFLPPLYTFTIADPENVVALVVFAIVAVVASNLAARLRAQAIAARDARRRPPKIFIFSAASSPARPRSTMSSGRAFIEIALLLKVNVVLLLPKNGRLELAARLSPGGSARRGRSRRREMELREKSRRRARRRHIARRQAAFHSDANRTGRDRCDRHRLRALRASADARRMPVFSILCPIRRRWRSNAFTSRRISKRRGWRRRRTGCGRRC